MIDLLRIARRALKSWLFDVPLEIPRRSAISACFMPSTSCSTSAIR